MTIDFTKDEIVVLGRTLPLFIENLEQKIDYSKFRNRYLRMQSEFFEGENVNNKNLLAEDLLATLPSEETIEKYERDVISAQFDLERYKDIFTKVERYSSLFLEETNSN